MEQKKTYKVRCIKNVRQFQKDETYSAKLVELRKGYRMFVYSYKYEYYFGVNTYFKYFLDINELRKKKLLKINKS